MFMFILSCALGHVMSNSFAAEGVRVGYPIYSGNGCPQGSVEAVLNQKSVFVLFDQFSAEAGKTTGRTKDIKTCLLAIPVHIPIGMRVSLVAVDFRGFNSLPKGSYSTLNIEHYFSNKTAPMYKKTFLGQQNQEYLLTSKLSPPEQVWSPCGVDTHIRIHSRIATHTNSTFEEALSTVDSAALRSGLVYHFEWETCQ